MLHVTLQLPLCVAMFTLIKSLALHTLQHVKGLQSANIQYSQPLAFSYLIHGEKASTGIDSD